MSASSAPPPPPSGPPPEVLDSASVPSVPPSRRRLGWKKGLLLGGGLVGLTAASVGAWAAYQFFQTGPQPAEALPANTLAYASIDLDPSGGQKLAALKTLNKFPKFKDAVGLSARDDLRQKIFDEVQRTGACKDLDYDHDIKPWLGDRAAVAAVDVGYANPQPVVVLQVSDQGKADQGLQAIADCSGRNATTGESNVGWHIGHGWAVVAESDSIADKVATAAGQHSLADDATYQHWTGEAGKPGVATMYVGPSAGSYLASHLDDLAGFPLGSLSGLGSSGLGSSPGGGFVTLPDSIKQKLQDFKGMAATVRFSDGAVELSVASGGSGTGGSLSNGAAADTVETLPSDTGLALGFGLKAGWFSQLLGQVASFTGQTPAQLTQELAQQTGLQLPQDAETLAGHSAAIAVSPHVSAAELSSPGGASTPVAVKIEGDPAQIEKVLDKVRAEAGPASEQLGSSTHGNSIAIGPDAGYRQDVVGDGSLGDNSVYRDVVRESDKAGLIVFVDVDQYDALVKQLTEGHPDLAANIEPISGFGATSWTDGDVSHTVVRLTTD